ncbi:nitroreductase family deazaflavin-dependent oxidoreductase [Tomitella gaofuii]|uniref:nitroreductase family deazaflavin-dependent oxidoreductase n=1 Tax=Tomitella gaofuii TaxID=2760083 RepID=UPI001F20A25A|nr:nitroreductase family deazaflavin-dependent oxidoreductase [Tomitella gaofuii]
MTLPSEPLPRTRRPRNPLSALARRLGLHEWLMRLAPAIILVESFLRRWSGNRMSLVGIAGLPSVQITVPGRRTGIPRTTALLAVPLDDGFIVTGSNWGRAEAPAWAWNVGAVEHAEVHVGARTVTMRVHRVREAERPQYWADIVHYWPGYAMEQRLAPDRLFPMFHLRQCGGTAPPGPATHGAAPTGDDAGGSGGRTARKRPA